MFDLDLYFPLFYLLVISLFYSKNFLLKWFLFYSFFLLDLKIMKCSFVSFLFLIFEFNFLFFLFIFFMNVFTDSFSVLNQIGYIDWHLINVCIVEGFNVFQRTLIIFSNKIDSNTFTAETSTATNSMNVVFSI